MSKKTLARAWADATGRSHGAAILRFRLLSEAGLLPDLAIGPRLRPLDYNQMATALIGLVVPDKTADVVEITRKWRAFTAREPDGSRSASTSTLGDALAAVWCPTSKLSLTRMRISHAFQWAVLTLAAPALEPVDPDHEIPTATLVFADPGPARVPRHGLTGVEDERVIYEPLIRYLADSEKPVPPRDWLHRFGEAA